MWGFELTVMVAMIAVNSVFAAHEIALALYSLALRLSVSSRRQQVVRARKKRLSHFFCREASPLGTLI